MDVLHNIVNLFLLLAGIAMILLGEEFFRLLLSVSDGKIASKIKKSFAFLISGFVTALTGLIILRSLGIKGETIYTIIGLVLFAVGGILSMCFYRYGIMTSYFLGAQAIFIVMFSPYFESYDGVELTLDRISGVCSKHMGSYLFVIALFILFGIYFHRKKAIRENDDEQQLQDKLQFRKTVYLCAGLAVFSYFIMLISRGYTTIFEINIINWPIIAFVFFWFIKWLADGGYKYSFIHNDKWAKFAYLIAFGLIVLPIISVLITSVISKLLPMDFPRRRLYCNFTFCPLPAFTFRSAFSIIAFSILAYDFLLKKHKLKFWRVAPVKMEVNMTYLITGIIVGGLVGIIVGALVGVIGGLIYNSGGDMYSRSYDAVGVGLLIGIIMGSIILATIGGKVALLLQAKKEARDEK